MPKGLNSDGQRVDGVWGTYPMREQGATTEERTGKV